MIPSSESLPLKGFLGNSNAASSIVGVTYGIQIADENDSYIRTAETALEGMAMASAPGAFLVRARP